jgi:hypothetical protein
MKIPVEDQAGFGRWVARDAIAAEQQAQTILGLCQDPSG